MCKGLGKTERQILATLKTYREIDMQWTWHTIGGYLSILATAEDIALFEKGNIVPLWILQRDVPCGKSVLARSLKTLKEKGLIRMYRGDLDSVDDYRETHFAKFISLTGKLP